MPQPYRAGCANCARRHQSCDLAQPTCSSCHRLNVTCEPSTAAKAWRGHDYHFSPDQTWLNSRKRAKVSFVEDPHQQTLANDGKRLPNTLEAAQSNRSESQSPVAIGPPSIPQKHPHRHILKPLRHLGPTPSAGELAHQAPKLKPLDINTSEYNSQQSSELPAFSWNNNPGLENQHPTTLRDTPHLSRTQNLPLGDEQTHDKIPFSGTSYALQNLPAWPLTDPEEAKLFRHYVQNLAIWLDLCDPLRHFEVYVPQKASKSPLLRNAIFALAARHLSHTRDYDIKISRRYHDKCIQELIASNQSDNSTMAEETFFAAAIILRVLEEIEYFESEDNEVHMSGIQVYADAHNRHEEQGSLSEAAFWVGLRQDIFIASTRKRPIALKLDHAYVNRLNVPNQTNDFTAANRAVVHCADVLNYCYSMTEKTANRWEELRSSLDTWYASRPSTFEPMFFMPENREKGEVFPQFWLIHSCQVIGFQHYYLAKLLLNSSHETIKTADEDIHTLRMLCGIAMSNRWTAPGLFTACMGISICGDLFEDKYEQEAILEVLVITEKEHARPTTGLQNVMKQLWGW